MAARLVGAHAERVNHIARAAGCYEPVNYLEYCAGLPVSKDFKFQLDEDGEIV